MASIEAATQYGTLLIFKDISFFDILKNRNLKNRERCLSTATIGFGCPIGFPTIPFRN